MGCRRRLSAVSVLTVVLVLAACESGPEGTYAPDVKRVEPNEASEPVLFRRDFDYDGGVLHTFAGDGGSSAAPFGTDAGDAPRLEPAPEQLIELGEAVRRVVYVAERHEAHAIAPVSRELLRIDLASRAVERSALEFEPVDLCVDAGAGRLFVVDANGEHIAEFALADGALVRDIAWGAPSWTGFSDAMPPHYHVRCAGDALYAVDARWEPGLWRIDLGDDPQVHDLSAQVSAIGELEPSADGLELYMTVQLGWSAGAAGSDLRRLDGESFEVLDDSAIGFPLYRRDPFDAPLLLDEAASLVANKQFLFDAGDFSTPRHTFDDEGVIALDGSLGLIATDAAVYRLSDLEQVDTLVAPGARLAFFDADGVLQVVSNARRALISQAVAP